MSVTLNDLYSKLWARVGPSVKPYDFYLACNEAIDELNSKNFVTEAEYDLQIENDTGIGDLTDIAVNVLKVKAIRNHLFQRLIRKDTGGEYIANYADHGELVYEHIGNEIRVKLPLSSNVFISDQISFSTDDYLKYEGTTPNFWQQNKLIPGMEFTVSGAGEAANNATWTVSLLASGTISGSHTASDGEWSLEDDTKSWGVDALKGLTITNMATFGTGIIVSNTATKLYAVLNRSYAEGGFWNNGDGYVITEQSGNLLYVVEPDILVDEASGSDITFTLDKYVYKLSGIFSLPKFSTFSPTASLAIEDTYNTAIILKSMLILIARKKIDPALAEMLTNDYNNELAMLMQYQLNRKEG